MINLIDNNLEILYCRIDLSKTNYTQLASAELITDPNIIELNEIFKQYCDYKQFTSVEPMWDSEFTWSQNDVIGYYDQNKLVAWSVVTKYSKHDIYSIQFAWDYINPRLSLGINSIKSECAYYKSLGYRYYYLGEAHKYKYNIDGFELLGKI
jgi:arginyl-tRNA--protein-N-Asp/Glu arginylyltransferase